MYHAHNRQESKCAQKDTRLSCLRVKAGLNGAAYDQAKVGQTGDELLDSYALEHASENVDDYPGRVTNTNQVFTFVDIRTQKADDYQKIGEAFKLTVFKHLFFFIF